MARVTVEDCLDEVPNRFALVILASGRTRQLKKGAKETVKRNNNKTAVVSLREIAEGHVYYEGDLEDILRKELAIV